MTRTALLIAFTCLTGVTWADALKLGDTVPTALSFADESGTVHTFAEYRGKPVVLEWLNNGCPFTHKHYDGSAMPNLQKAETAQGTIWLGVTSSAEGKQGYLTPATAKAALAKLGFQGTHTILDSQGTLGRMFGAETTPHMFVLNGSGKLIYRGAIDSIPSFDAADIPTATNYITQTMAELRAGKPISTPSTRPYGCSIKY